ncbi:MAG: M20 family metallopeptidase [Bacillota bacterium]
MDQLFKKVTEKIDREYVVNLLKELIEIPSANPPGDVSRISRRVEKEMRDIGITDIEIVEPVEGRRNVIGRIGNGNGPTITLYAHLDVVPVREEEEKEWRTPPLKGTIVDGKMYGRGAADTKSGLAAMLAAARALVETGAEIPGRVVFLAAADGETGDIWGIKYLEEKGLIGGDMVIACEPSGFQIIRLFKGRIWFEVSVKGKAVHASVPEQGVNAIIKMVKVVDALNNAKHTFVPHDILGDSTIAFSTIQGGSVPNAVAGHCKATFDVRLVPGQTVEGVKSELQAVLDRLKKEDPELEVTLDILPGAGREVCETPLDAKIVRHVQEAFKYVMGTDAPFGAGIESPGAVYHFNRLGAQGVFFGPGAIWEAHLPNEFVILDRLYNMAKMYAVTILKATKA